MDSNGAGILGMGIVGLFVGVMLLVVAIVWILFPFIMMGRIKEVKEAIEKGNIHTMGLSHEAARTNELLTAIAASLKGTRQTSDSLRPISTEVSPSPTAQPLAPIAVNVSKDGTDIGSLPIHTVKQMLKDRKLSPQDFYFDTASNDWLPLESDPRFFP